jgi:hypothetical protein
VENRSTAEPLPIQKMCAYNLAPIGIRNRDPSVRAKAIRSLDHAASMSSKWLIKNTSLLTLF